MSHSENCENLLIDFNNITVSNDGPSDNMERLKLTTAERNNDSSSSNQAMNQILCSSQPLYKLLAESNDVGANNPFDHFDKQAGLLDDPFEIVANAALTSMDSVAASTVGALTEVKTATLISFDSTLSDTSKSTFSSNDSNSTLCNDTQLNDSVQNTSQKQTSATKNLSRKASLSPSTGNSTRKVKNSSVTLLKFSLSNSRIDLIANENNVSSSGEENVCDTKQKKHKLEMRRDSGTDDSFDDIWSTIPNLVDSQTEIDIESDIDSDIARLNIPMLTMATPESKYEENVSTDSISSDQKESNEMKTLNRSNIREKLASIKQSTSHVVHSPAPIDAAAVTSSSSPLLLPSSTAPTIPIHNQTVDIPSSSPSQSTENKCNETTQSATQRSPIEVQHQQNVTSNNPDSLIENLQKLVDQCDDKHQQMTAKHLLDDLSSILTKTNANEKNNTSKTSDGSKRQPPKIKRQGTFNIDRDSCGYLNNKSSDQDETNRSNDSVKDETQVIDSEFSQMVKQIQNAFGSHQNINILQSNDQSMAMPSEGASSVNPTFIVVMAQPQLSQPTTPAPATGYNEDDPFSRFHRSRSQSLTLKERPLAAMRATQHKIEQLRGQAVAQVTPIKSTISQRRRSFGNISQLANNNNDTQPTVKPAPNQQPLAKPDAPKLPRRRSLHGPIEQANQQEIVKSNLSNQIARRRSYQAPSMATGIRLPSPKKNLNSARSSAAPLRQSNAMGMLARRKSFTPGEMIKDSPLKIKTSYDIMKKPAVPPVTRNLKIRVSQSTTGRSTAPLRAVVPMKQVTPLHLINDTVAPVDDKRKMSTLITSTPRSIPSPIKLKTDPVESPIQNLLTPPSTSAQSTMINAAQRRRTISDYRSQVNSSVTVTADSNPGGKISSLKNATKTLATGLSRFTAKRMSSIGLKRPSSSGSKENKQP